MTLKIDGEGVVGGPYPRPSFYKLWSKGRSGINPWAVADNPVVAPFDQSVRNQNNLITLIFASMSINGMLIFAVLFDDWCQRGWNQWIFQ